MRRGKDEQLRNKPYMPYHTYNFSKHYRVFDLQGVNVEISQENFRQSPTNIFFSLGTGILSVQGMSKILSWCNQKQKMQQHICLYHGVATSFKKSAWPLCFCFLSFKVHLSFAQKKDHNSAQSCSYLITWISNNSKHPSK